MVSGSGDPIRVAVATRHRPGKMSCHVHVPGLVFPNSRELKRALESSPAFSRMDSMAADILGSAPDKPVFDLSVYRFGEGKLHLPHTAKADCDVPLEPWTPESAGGGISYSSELEDFVVQPLGIVDNAEVPEDACYVCI
jgi:hypothetical protein